MHYLEHPLSLIPCVALMRKKNQFKNENMNLKQENDDLRLQLELLEGKLSESDIPVSPSCCFVANNYNHTHYSRESAVPPPRLMSLITQQFR